MPIGIRIEGAKPVPFLTDPVPVVPAVPSKRETLEALATIEGMLKRSGVICPRSFETLRNFIITR